MPSIYDLKPGFQKLLRPLTSWLARSGVTANQITILAALLSIGTGAALAVFPGNHRVLFLVPAVLFVRMALNAVDGMLAREHNMKSRLGAILNEIGDVVSDSFLYLPLALVPGIASWLVVISVVLAIVSEMMGVVAVQIGASRRYDGPMGKSDRAFLMGLFCLVTASGIPAESWSIWLFGLICGLLTITIWNRGARALKEANSQ